MAWVHIPGYDSVSGPLREFWDRYRAKSGGRVANILRIQGLKPKQLLAHHGLYRAIMFGPAPLTRRERELAAVVVSKINGCHY